MVWENVCGAFSSNKGRDFQRVLSECVRIAEPSAPDVPYPDKGKWTRAGILVGDGWSLAWRVLDAQYWGVPQRRRRIALVCDFGGQSAGEILFNEQSLSGHFTESGTPEKRTAGSAGDGAHPAIAGSSPIDGELNAMAQGFGETGIGYWQSGIQTLRAEGENRPSRPSNVVVQNGVKCLNPWDSQSGRVYDESGIWHSLIANENAGMQRDAVFCSEAIPIHDKATRYQGGGAARNGDGSGNGLGIGKDGDPCFTLTSADRHAVYDARGNGDGKTVCTLTGDHQNRVTDYTPIVARRLTANSYKQKGRADAETYLSKGSVVRRLTPLEAERLQGYPDGYTDIGDWTDNNGKTHKTSDSARYRALGNSIALPPWKWVLKRIAAQYERDATLGSLFDGIGGFPLLWEQFNGKGSAVWASEVEPFCIAVTKKRIGGNEPGAVAG